jgi:hypothetical protein
MKLVLQRALGTDMPWQQVASVGYETTDTETGARRAPLEIDMENLVIQQPQILLSGLTGGLPVVVIKDFPLRPDAAMDADAAYRFPDLIAFDAVGGVYAIECKLGKNPEAQGEVLNQIRRYGERLRRLRYADLTSTNQRKQKRRIDDEARRGRTTRDSRHWSEFPSIADLMKEALDKAPPISSDVRAPSMTWSSSEWEQAVDENIVRGSVRLAVAADHVHARLHECLGTWNASLGRESYEAVWAIELLRIVHEGSEFLIPQVTLPRSATSSRATTFEETLRLATGSGRAVDGRVVQWAKATGLGTRTTAVSRQVIGRDGQRLVTLYLNPKIDKLELNLEPLATAEGAAGAVRAKIAALFGGPVAETYPNINLDAINGLWDAFAADVLQDLEKRRNKPVATNAVQGG